jgi:hypothetical protein
LATGHAAACRAMPQNCRVRRGKSA